jgi:hypothetical protein
MCVCIALQKTSFYIIKYYIKSGCKTQLEAGGNCAANFADL